MASVPAPPWRPTGQPPRSALWPRRCVLSPGHRREARGWGGVSVDPPEVHSPPETSPPRDARRAIARWLPILAALRGYGPASFRAVLVAAIVLSALLVPAGMGYAEAAGLPAITGLYATVGPLVAYFLVGPSRILVLGPDSALIAPIAATIIPLAGGDGGRSVALAAGERDDRGRDGSDER